jgi:hypothetical protein
MRASSGRRSGLGAESSAFARPCRARWSFDSLIRRARALHARCSGAAWIRNWCREEEGVSVIDSCLPLSITNTGLKGGCRGVVAGSGGRDRVIAVGGNTTEPERPARLARRRGAC